MTEEEKIKAQQALQELADSGNIGDYLLGTEEEEEDNLDDIRIEDAREQEETFFKESE